MNRKQKIRYLLAIYGIILAIAVIIAVAVLLGQPAGDTRLADWKSFWLNISTELIGAVAVFIIVNILFLLDDWDLGERVAQLLHRLERERPSADKFFHKLPDLEPYILSAQQIDMAGFTLTSAINKNLSNLIEQLAQGANIRIMIVDPVLKLTREDNPSLDITYNQTRIAATFTDLTYLFEKHQALAESGATGSLKVGLLSQPLGTGLYGFNTHQADGKFIVEMYPPHISSTTPPAFTVLQQEDERWFHYFQAQFEEIWSKTTCWSPSTYTLDTPASKTLSQASADSFLWHTIFSYGEFIAQANEVWMYGDTLQSSIKHHLHVLNMVLSNGGCIKVVLSTEAMIHQDTDPVLRQETIKSLKWLQRNPQNRGSIELREFENPRVFSMHIIDPNTPNGRIFVSMHTPIKTYERSPKFELVKARDEYWFNYFMNQFNQVWEQSTPISLNPINPVDMQEQ